MTTPIAIRPGLEDLHDQTEQNLGVGINCVMLGEVTRYREGPPATVDVQLLANQIHRDDTTHARPIIARVPILFPSFGPVVIRAVPEVGDAVVCHVMDREIRTYLDGRGGKYTPNPARTHDKNDIVAYPGIRRRNKAPVGTDKRRTLYIGREDGEGTFLRIDVGEAHIELKASDGDLASSGRIDLESAGDTDVTVGAKFGLECDAANMHAESTVTIDAGIRIILGNISEGALGNARLTDSVASTAAFKTWMGLVNGYVASIPTPLTPPEILALSVAFNAALASFGVISTASSKVLSQ